MIIPISDLWLIRIMLLFESIAFCLCVHILVKDYRDKKQDRKRNKHPETRDKLYF